MDVIPAVDILAGQAVRLYQGDYSQSTGVGDPLSLAKHWQSQGATRLHVVDLDGAKTGDPVNDGVIRALVRELSLPIQVGGGIRSRQRVRDLLELGVDRVILGTAAVENPELVRALCQEFPGRIVVGIDAKGGRVATRGWLRETELLATDLVASLDMPGLAAVIFTDIQRDGTLQGVNRESLSQVLAVSPVPVIASGGVGSLTDLLGLLGCPGLAGVIVGKALYSGAFSLTEAIRAVGNGRWQDVPPAGSESTVC